MDRRELILALLACAGGATYTPVQLQKAAFLVTRQIPDAVSGAKFNFTPYDYGPFDAAVYTEAQALAAQGDAAIGASPFGSWNVYAATPAGVTKGQRILEELPATTGKYLGEVAEWVRRQSFSGLVKSIYDAYPDMRANSIFRD